MDKTSDSGSGAAGSIPVGCTQGWQKEVSSLFVNRVIVTLFEFFREVLYEKESDFGSTGTFYGYESWS